MKRNGIPIDPVMIELWQAKNEHHIQHKTLDAYMASLRRATSSAATAKHVSSRAKTVLSERH